MTARKRGRRTDSEVFMAKLSSSPDGKASNRILTQKLKWTTEKYNRIKNQLLDEGLIEKARGYGGAVRLLPPEEPKPEGLSVFISYSHRDKDLMNHLKEHLKPLERINLIKPWTDNELQPGVEWETTIFQELNKASLILLLISIDFINSNFCFQQEMERAMERHDNQEAQVVPIILRDCLWNHTPFAKLQALPTEAKPVTVWPNLDQAFKDVARGIELVARDMQ